MGNSGSQLDIQAKELWQAAKRPELPLPNHLQVQLNILPPLDLQKMLNWFHSRKGTTAMMEACQRGHVQLVALLIDQVNLQVRDKSTTANSPCHFACQANQVKIVQLFLQQKEKQLLHCLNNLGHSPLDVARFSSAEAVVSLLHEQLKIHQGWLHMKKSNSSLLWKQYYCRLLRTMDGTGSLTNAVELAFYTSNTTPRPKYVLLYEPDHTRIEQKEHNYWYERDFSILLSTQVLESKGVNNAAFKFFRYKGSQFSRIDRSISTQDDCSVSSLSSTVCVSFDSDSSCQSWMNHLTDGARTCEINEECHSPVNFGSPNYSKTHPVSCLSFESPTKLKKDSFHTKGIPYEPSAPPLNLCDNPIIYSSASLTQNSVEKSSFEEAPNTSKIASTFQGEVHQSSTADFEECCVVCMVNNVNSVCIPCGHMCVCTECKDLIVNTNALNNKTGIAQCPICRSSVDQIVQVYK